MSKRKAMYSELLRATESIRKYKKASLKWNFLTTGERKRQKMDFSRAAGGQVR